MWRLDEVGNVECRRGVEKFVDTDAKNRYCDSKFVHSHLTNSWQLEIEDLDQGNSNIESVCSFK